MATKTVVIIADLHCGHFAGLTPPAWHTGANRMPATARLQRETWGWYRGRLANSKPDLLIVNADCIDGRGERSGGTELITGDREEQAEMATAAIKIVDAKNIIMTYGTPYHVSNGGEDYEHLIARELGCQIMSHAWTEINGRIFDVKHKVGAGQLHGAHTPVARERLHNLLWAEMNEGQPLGDFIIRSHIHMFTYCGKWNYLAITTPALQAAQTKYGGRQCSSVVDYGYLEFTVDTKGRYQWHPELLHVKNTAAKPVKF